jgi:hypothetical protein
MYGFLSKFVVVKQKAVVQELIEKEVQKGFLSGPHDKLPFDSYRVSPIGIAEGKYSHKKRLIVDLSSPHDSEIHQSLNNVIDKEECSLSYVAIDDAIRHIIECGRGAWMCKADISEDFKLIPISPSQYHLFCIKWCDAYYFYTKSAFGCRSSPNIFNEISKAICWIAENKYGIARILHLLDDFLTIDAPDVDRNRTMALLTMIFYKLNVPLAKHKTMCPLKVIEYLRIILDSVSFSALSNPIAFSVALTHNVTLTNGAHVTYDKILTNAGNGYNQNTGEFVVSVEGLYIIHYHALAAQGEVGTLNDTIKPDVCQSSLYLNLLFIVCVVL